MDERRKILQIIPAQPGATVQAVIDGKLDPLPIVCWALTEWHDEDGVNTDIQPIVLQDHRNPVVLWDIKELKEVFRISLY